MSNWQNKERGRTSAFSEKAQVKIKRTPPEDNRNPQLITNYHLIIDDLEALYTQYVQEAEKTPMRDALDSYDENRDRLFARLSEVFSERGLDSSGVGGMIQEHQDKLQEAAYAEIDRLAEAAKQKKAMQDFLRKGI